MTRIDWTTLNLHVFPPSALLPAPAGRAEQVAEWLRGMPVLDADGNETGELVPLITPELAKKLLEEP